MRPERIIIRFIKFPNELDSRWPREEWHEIPIDEEVGEC